MMTQFRPNRAIPGGLWLVACGYRQALCECLNDGVWK